MNDYKRNNKLVSYAIAVMSFISIIFLPTHVEASETGATKGGPGNPYIISTDVTFAPLNFKIPMVNMLGLISNC